MKKRLVNVRLDEEQIRRVEALRNEGIPFSQLVREAIDIKYAAVVAPQNGLDMESLIEELFEAYPDPVDLGPRDYDVHDRRAAQKAVRRRIAGQK